MFSSNIKRGTGPLLTQLNRTYIKGMVFLVILHFLVVPPNKQLVQAVILVGLENE